MFYVYVLHSLEDHSLYIGFSTFFFFFFFFFSLFSQSRKARTSLV